MSVESTFLILTHDHEVVMDALRAWWDDNPGHGSISMRLFDPVLRPEGPSGYLAFHSHRGVIGGGNHLDPRDIVRVLRTIKVDGGWPCSWALTYSQEQMRGNGPDFITYNDESTGPVGAWGVP